MKLTWIYQFSDAQVDEILALMHNEWWCSGRNLDDVKKMLENTDVLIGALDGDGVLAGFARVLTDYTYKALIFDVIVKPTYRDIGLGRDVVQHILDLPALNGVQSFELYCPEHIAGFYQKLGFSVSTSQLLRYKKLAE